MRFGVVLAAMVALPAMAQDARPMKGPPAPGSTPAPAQADRVITETITADPAAPARSTLKPVTDPGDGTQPRQRLVTVFGTEPCPKPTSPDEVVVCARLPESEIYRIPTPLRQAERRRSPFEENRAMLVGEYGGTGFGTCSAVGASGVVNCSRRQVDAWAADRAGRMGYEEPVPRQ